MNNESYQSLISYISDELNKYIITENINDDENIIIDNENIPIEINQEDLIVNRKFEGFRKNQELARTNNIKQNFKSGVYNQVTGAGKSIIMMLTINDHYEINKDSTNGKLYIITCQRIEVLSNLFFEKINLDTWIINTKNKQFWKDNKIIDFDIFNIIDRVNIKKKKKIKLN